ncbi:MAG TPA: sigma-70 family RNA polymerase sigma factor [Caulifigura sp.]|nr:sigma-70 family RNA polymerase sigma factor [Caulifigura sp.]
MHSDQALIDRSLAGESEAFGELVRRHQDRLFGSLSHLLGSVHDAADVAQDAFVLAYRNLNRFRGQSAFYSWLFRIAYNAAVNHQRRHRRKSQSLDGRRDELGEEPVDGRASSDPASGLQTNERSRIIREALDELGEDYRNALVLKEIEGLPYEEIASVMECPVGTVRSRIHRARHELRDKLTRVMKASDL